MSETELRPVELPRTERLPALDLLRGLVMVVMALDHTRDFFHHAEFSATDLSRTTALLFFTRWITHFCAPVFVFLAGTGAFLYGNRGRTRGELASFLFTRGLWLVFLEVTWVRFSWRFDLDLRHIGLQVIWAIGVSMIVLSVLVYLPRAVITMFGLLMIATHNLLDSIVPEPGGSSSIWLGLLHQQQRYDLGDGWTIGVLYPLIPWIGVMATGYGFGSVLLLPRERRRRTVAWLGVAVCALFVIVRAINAYGDPKPWSDQGSSQILDTTDGAVFLGEPRPFFTLLSFLNCTKYPPSLDYLLMTLGPALLFLAWADREVPKLARPLVVFGRVPMFFYLLHIPLIHLSSILVDLVRHGQRTAVDFNTPPPDDWGFGLPGVYLAWILIVLALYFPCRWFAGVKQRRHEAWLSYF